MQIRCPHCRSPVDLETVNSFADVECTACGSYFRFAGQDLASTLAREPRLVGHFKLMDLLGTGSFGSVWKAWDTELDRWVAVKLPRKEQLSQSEINAFLREAQTVAGLKHPRIVTVHEVGHNQGSIYIVTELIQGVPLNEWLAVKAVTPRDAATIAKSIAEALAHAHGEGVIHRDLKPSNILMDVDGQPFVVDFGLARRENIDVTVTMDGQVIGTPAYMSPEQAKGEGHQTDGRGDIYSLGVILFEMLTGELPFRGSFQMLLFQVIHDEPPSPRKLQSHIPRDLETITLKCLEKEPDRRYAAASELAEDLHRYLEGSPIKARPCSLFGRAWRWYHRNSTTVVVTAGAYATVLAIILFGWEILALFAIVGGFVEGSPRMLIELVACILVFHPLTLAIGIFTLKGHFPAVVAGTLGVAVWSAVTLVSLFGGHPGLPRLELLSVARLEPFYHMQLTTLLMMLAAIGGVLYTVALVTTVRERLAARQGQCKRVGPPFR